MTLTSSLTIPNALSILRLLLAPVLLYLAWLRAATWFIGILVLAFFLDLVDGVLARRFNQVSELGAKFDSWADFSVYLAFLCGAYLLWPDIVRREWPYVATVAGSIVVPVIFAIAKFKAPLSLHTWLVKAGAAAMAPSAIYLFLSGVAWPFHIATVICVLAALEQILIVCLLSSPRPNVKSIVHVLHDAQAKTN